MKKMYTVGWRLPNGDSGEIRTCCERNTATRLLALGRRRVIHLDQPDDLPRTCQEHSYE